MRSVMGDESWTAQQKQAVSADIQRIVQDVLGACSEEAAIVAVMLDCVINRRGSAAMQKRVKLVMPKSTAAEKIVSFVGAIEALLESKYASGEKKRKAHPDSQTSPDAKKVKEENSHASHAAVSLEEKLKRVSSLEANLERRLKNLDSRVVSTAVPPPLAPTGLSGQPAGASAPPIRTAAAVSFASKKDEPIRAGPNPYFEELSGEERLAERKRKASFRFVKPGTFVKEGERFRSQWYNDMMRKEMEDRSKQIPRNQQQQTEVLVRKSLAALLRTKRDDIETPVVEWWDSPFTLTQEQKDDNGGNEQECTGTGTIPPALKPDPLALCARSLYQLPRTQPQPKAPLPSHMLTVKLTKEERKKMRRRLRLAATKEKQERVRLGLEEPAAPRLTLKNYMSVLGDAALKNPTQVEGMVRKQIAQRLIDHETRNQAEKLTPAMRKEKRERKLVSAEARGLVAAVFVVEDLADNRLQYLVRSNALSWHLTGTALCSPSLNCVIVEGGKQAVEKYIKLMTRRIRWRLVLPRNEEERNGACDTDTKGKGNENDAALDAKGEMEEKEDDAEQQERNDLQEIENSCHLVWRGDILERNFPSFWIELVSNDITARKFAERHHCEHYWDCCLNFDSQDEQ
jgi:hypothetical protein